VASKISNKAIRVHDHDDHDDDSDEKSVPQEISHHQKKVHRERSSRSLD